MGYATGQFGKNHLGDLNEFLPTVHGFDEFFGYLYHLDAMEDPAHPDYPQELLNRVGPRNMVHSLGDRHDDPTVDAALGQGRQAEDRGRRHALPEADGDGRRRDPRPGARIHRQGEGGRQAVLRLAQPDPDAHRHAPVARSTRRCGTPKNGWSDSGSRHGAARRHRRRGDEEAQGHRASTTTPSSSSPPTTATEIFTWPDGGQTPFAGGKGTVMEGGFRVPAIVRWPGKVPAGKVENGIISGLDWFPTLVAAAGNPNIADGAQEGQEDRRPDLQGPSRRLRPDRT